MGYSPWGHKRTGHNLMSKNNSKTPFKYKTKRSEGGGQVSKFIPFFLLYLQHVGSSFHSHFIAVLVGQYLGISIRATMGY